MTLRPTALVAFALVTLGVGCATSPAMKSPLREALSKAETPTVEDATRDCLTSLGWKVDPVGSVSGGSNVVSAKNKETGESTQVYVNQPDQKPRITGGPDDPKFWECLKGKLAPEGAGDDKADKDKGDDKGDKGGGDDKHGDGDKGGSSS